MMPHLRKVFENLVKLELESDEMTATAMISAEGEQVILKNCVKSIINKRDRLLKKNKTLLFLYKIKYIIEILYNFYIYLSNKMITINKMQRKLIYNLTTTFSTNNIK